MLLDFMIRLYKKKVRSSDIRLITWVNKYYSYLMTWKRYPRDLDVFYARKLMSTYTYTYFLPGNRSYSCSPHIHHTKMECTSPSWAQTGTSHWIRGMAQFALVTYRWLSPPTYPSCSHLWGIYSAWFHWGVSSWDNPLRENMKVWNE